ncbi:hypothetical protein [Burkholderia gladioli]|nr:hypothetical protein [Burkholderia gladioli]MDN7805697.1 hypothetical protein [Burkholderia gladioli]
MTDFISAGMAYAGAHPARFASTNSHPASSRPKIHAEFREFLEQRIFQ